MQTFLSYKTMERLRGNKNVSIRSVSTKEEWKAAEIEDINDSASYYKTTEDRIDYLLQLIYEAHYEECKNGVFPRLDRNVINFR